MQLLRLTLFVASVTGVGWLVQGHLTDHIHLPGLKHKEHLRGLERKDLSLNLLFQYDGIPQNLHDASRNNTLDKQNNYPVRNVRDKIRNFQ